MSGTAVIDSCDALKLISLCWKHMLFVTLTFLTIVCVFFIRFSQSSCSSCRIACLQQKIRYRVLIPHHSLLWLIEGSCWWLYTVQIMSLSLSVTELLYDCLCAPVSRHSFMCVQCTLCVRVTDFQKSAASVYLIML